MDTCSTHSFIEEEVERRTGLPAQPRPRLTATVANGEKIACPAVFRRAPISINSMLFTVDLFVMPLAGYDMVMGMQRMATLGCIEWDVPARTMAFHRQGKRVCWQGVASPHGPGVHVAADDGSLLEGLLGAFDDVFAEPTGLPPPRTRDHAITLKSGASPVSVRPYRYPVAHKDELERQCAAMIAQGIVRRSDSAFSSPVLLVKKSDGS